MIVASSRMSGRASFGEASSTQLAWRLFQGEVRSGAGDVLERPEPDRLAFEGWVRWDTIPSRHRRDGVLSSLSAFFDAEGPDAARALAGDFVIAHVAPQEHEVSLYRGLTSSIALYWSSSLAELSWAVDPAELLPKDQQPSLSHIDIDVLPLLLGEFGAPLTNSAYRGVRRLPPGDRLQWRPGSESKRSSFDQFTPCLNIPKNVKDAAEGLRERLAMAARSALDGSTAAVTFLSGGIDSAVTAFETTAFCPNLVNLHCTLSGFPGFELDAESAKSVSDSINATFISYDLGPHVAPGGDYLASSKPLAQPFTHAPVPMFRVGADIASKHGSPFILTGLLADCLFMTDWREEQFPVPGISALNPLNTGRPIWQALARAGEEMGGADGRRRSGFGAALAFLWRLARADPMLSLLDQSVMCSHVGLTDQAIRTLEKRTLEFAEGTLAKDTLSNWMMLQLELSSHHLHAGYVNDLRPQSLFHHSIYANRDVIEYCISLPKEYKQVTACGVRATKFLLRYAYSFGQIPKPVAWRTMQANLGAIPATWLHNNYERCASLLADDSVLASVGVLRKDFFRSLTPASIHRGEDALTRLVGVERWLREFT